MVVVACLVALPAAATAADVPPGAEWTQETISSSDGVKLHADVLRPEGLDPGAKTPVILSIGPYFNHSGQTGAVGPVQGTSYDPLGPSTGPSDRFNDLVEGGELMKRGYTYVMVDLRGFGGSTGCLDWVGPGEQADVVSAVEWAASQSWSTGKVGMYGKSYDGVTGLMGVNRQPAGLEAVVSQEPVYDLYRYLYGDGIRRENSLATPALYDLIDVTPGPALDDPAYNAGGLDDTQRPGCKAGNQLDQSGNDDHDSAYWKQRNLIPGAKGSNVPLFLTQGLTENNTVADGTAQYLQNHTGPERAWLGPWDHVRGNEADESGRLKMGRHGWFDEVMRFYDQHLKGVQPSVADPNVAVQTNDGKWRGEDSWPPADARLHLGAQPRQLHRRRRGRRHRGRRLGRVDHLPAAVARRPHGRLGQGGRRGVLGSAQVQPRGGRLRPRPGRHGAADHPPGLPRARERQGEPRSLVRRLEGRARPPDRRAHHRRQLRLVDPRADHAVGGGQRRLGHAALPHRGAHGHDRRRPRHPARGLPGRDDHGPARDDRGLRVQGLRAAVAAMKVVEVTVAAPVGVVWQALRDPVQIRRWHGWEYDDLDEEIRQIFIDATSVSDADQTLDTGEGRFELEQRGEETIVRIVRGAPAGECNAINEGWLTFVHQLRFASSASAGRTAAP